MSEQTEKPIRINIKDAKEENAGKADSGVRENVEATDESMKTQTPESMGEQQDSPSGDMEVEVERENPEDDLEEDPSSEKFDSDTDASVDAIESELEAARKEARENYDRFLRMSADFENFKKRTAREMESIKKFANEKLITELLPIADNLERAIESANIVEEDESEPVKKENGASIVEGVNMVYKELLKVFEKFGVTAIGSLGETFDPVIHEAVMQEPSGDVPENTVIREFHKGYMLNDRLLRPAMVVVSKAAK